MANNNSNNSHTSTVTVHCDGSGWGEPIKLDTNLLYQLAANTVVDNKDLVLRLDPIQGLKKAIKFVSRLEKMFPVVITTTSKDKLCFSFVAGDFLNATKTSVPDITAGANAFEDFAKPAIGINKEKFLLQ